MFKNVCLPCRWSCWNVRFLAPFLCVYYHTRGTAKICFKMSLHVNCNGHFVCHNSCWKIYFFFDRFFAKHFSSFRSKISLFARWFWHGQMNLFNMFRYVLVFHRIWSKWNHANYRSPFSWWTKEKKNDRKAVVSWTLFVSVCALLAQNIGQFSWRL